MKAPSRQAPVRPVSPRPMPSVGASLSAAVPPTIHSGAAWERWLDRRTSAFTDFAIPSPHACASPLSEAVQELLAGGESWSVAPARPVKDQPASLAAVRALASPDICLWKRSARQDVSAALAEVVRRAGTEGVRVLVLAATTEPLERLLARFAGDGETLAIYFTGEGERSINGPLARFDLDEQRLTLRARLLVRIGQAHADLEARRARNAVEAEVWPILSQCVREAADLEIRRRDMLSRVLRLEAEVRREADDFFAGGRPTGPFAAALSSMPTASLDNLAQHDHSLAIHRDHLAKLERARIDLAAERQHIEAKLEPLRAGRWWTLGYWQARFDASLRELEARCTEQADALVRACDQANAAVAVIEADRESAAAARGAEVASLIAAEIGRRRTEIERQAASLDVRRAQSLAHWSETCQRIAHAADRPTEPTLAAHDRANARWRERIAAEQSPCSLDTTPQEIADAMVARLAAYSPMLVGTVTALSSRAEFEDAANVPFDLVVIDDAERLSPTDLLSVLAKAPRALLIGDTESDASSFSTLWRHFHRTQPPTVYEWSRHASGIRCTLGKVAPADERFVESERLADFPEIELRILTARGQPPRLTQVVFPASMSAEQAKVFIYRELQEAAVDRVDRPVRVSSSAERVTIAWQCPHEPAEVLVELEPGLREAICVREVSLTTCRLEFDTASGWTQAKIDDWLRRHLPMLDAIRTAVI